MQPIGRTVRYPFDGKPRTREETDDNGNLAYRVIAKVLTPARAKVADRLGETTAAALMMLTGLYILNHDVPPTALLFAGAIWFLHPLFEKAWREGLKRNVEMVVTADQFRFRRWMRWISIDRVLPHRFALVVHDLARQERDKHEIETLKAQKRGKIVQPRRYHQELVSSLLRTARAAQRHNRDLRTPGCAGCAHAAAGDRRRDQRPRKAGRRHRHSPWRPVGRAAGRHPRNSRPLEERSDGFRTPRSRA